MTEPTCSTCRWWHKGHNRPGGECWHDPTPADTVASYGCAHHTPREPSARDRDLYGRGRADLLAEIERARWQIVPHNWDKRLDAAPKWPGEVK